MEAQAGQRQLRERQRQEICGLRVELTRTAVVATMQ